MLDNFAIIMLISGVMGYAFGSVPFGMVLTKLAGMGDVRKIGSGNIGATNVLRTGNKKIAIAVLLLDGAKGAFAIYLTHLFGLSEWIRDDPAMLAGLMAVVGHNYPVWLRFKGGKGVATTIGVILALNWLVGLIVCALWLLIAFITRYSSLAALGALMASPAAMAFIAQNDRPAASLMLLLWLLAMLRHRENINRLIKGGESKINLKSKSNNKKS